MGITHGFAGTPSCTVVVCTRSRPRELERCLAALARQVYTCFDVLVVDNAPPDSSARAVAQRWGARYLVEPVRGLSRARNTGARACSSEIVAFTDDDAVAEPGWLYGLIDEFQDPNVSVVTGRILAFARSAGIYAADIGPERISLDWRHPLWFEMACFGGIGNGGNMAFRRSLFDVWNGFDERLGRGALLSDGEEHRAFAELIERGCTITYAPAAVVRHPIPEPEDQRTQSLRSIADLSGFTIFLFLVTRQQWKVAKYALQALVGTTRAWRWRPATPVRRRAPRWRVLQACVAGVLRGLFVCGGAAFRLNRRGQSVPNAPSPRTRLGTVRGEPLRHIRS
jgi:GT2 family glycosyltransferase